MRPLKRPVKNSCFRLTCYPELSAIDSYLPTLAACIPSFADNPEIAPLINTRAFVVDLSPRSGLLTVGNFSL